jgi:hypothetical protein
VAGSASTEVVGRKESFSFANPIGFLTEQVSYDVLKHSHILDKQKGSVKLIIGHLINLREIGNVLVSSFGIKLNRKTVNIAEHLKINIVRTAQPIKISATLRTKNIKTSLALASERIFIKIRLEDESAYKINRSSTADVSGKPKFSISNTTVHTKIINDLNRVDTKLVIATKKYRDFTGSLGAIDLYAEGRKYALIKKNSIFVTGSLKASLEDGYKFYDDFFKVQEAFIRALGTQLHLVTDTKSLINPASYLISQLRYWIHRFPNLIDLDNSPYLTLLTNEIGIDLPRSAKMPLLEMARENRSWYGKKGTESLFKFIGALVGTKLEINTPQDLIFTLDGSKSALSGSMSGSGTPWNDSKLARIRDGEEWSHYTYIIKALQSQNIQNPDDLIYLINKVHPAGTKYFITWLYNWFVEKVTDNKSQSNYYEDIKWWSQPNKLDINFKLSSSRLSMMAGKYLKGWYVQIIDAIDLLLSARTIYSATLQHTWYENPRITFSYYGSNNTLVCAKDSSLLKKYLSKDFSLSEVSYKVLKERYLKEIECASYDLGSKTDNIQDFFYELPYGVVKVYSRFYSYTLDYRPILDRSAVLSKNSRVFDIAVSEIFTHSETVYSNIIQEEKGVLLAKAVLSGSNTNVCSLSGSRVYRMKIIEIKENDVDNYVETGALKSYSTLISYGLVLDR